MWLEYLRTFWPIAAWLMPILFIGAVAWLKTQFATKAQFEQLDARLDAHGDRILSLEEAAKVSPSRQDLQRGISDLAERMSGMEVGFKAMGHQLTTANNYLHTLINEGLKR